MSKTNVILRVCEASRGDRDAWPVADCIYRAVGDSLVLLYDNGWCYDPIACSYSRSMDDEDTVLDVLLGLGELRMLMSGLNVELTIGNHRWSVRTLGETFRIIVDLESLELTYDPIAYDSSYLLLKQTRQDSTTDDNETFSIITDNSSGLTLSWQGDVMSVSSQQRRKVEKARIKRLDNSVHCYHYVIFEPHAVWQYGTKEVFRSRVESTIKLWKPS